MNANQSAQRLSQVIAQLYKDAKMDGLRMMKGAAKSIFSPIQPIDFEGAYLAITKDQGEDLVTLICEHNMRNIVEFGTSFGISTLFLARGARHTSGRIVSTELLPSKARRAMENFKDAGVDDLIEVRVGDAMETLRGYDSPIDLLVLDGWKDLYQPLFDLLEPNFHADTVVYVDNADMADSRDFLGAVAQNAKYFISYHHDGKAALIRLQP